MLGVYVTTPKVTLEEDSQDTWLTLDPRFHRQSESLFFYLPYEYKMSVTLIEYNDDGI